MADLAPDPAGAAPVDRLRGPGLVLPASCAAAPGSASITDVLPAVAASLAAGLDLDLAQPVGAIDLPPSRRTCVVLVDGLGLENLAERSGHAPTLRGRLTEATALTTTFPSTTAAALAGFGASAFPGQTGMLGYTVRHPETGALANLVQWSGMPEPEAWQRVPTVLERLAGAGARVRSVGPARFAGSGMTRASLRGGEHVAAESSAARVDATLRALRDEGLVYLYWGDVDKTGHHHGWTSWQWGDALEAFDRELGRLVRLAPEGTRILVTADHGMIDVDPRLRWDVAQVPELVRDVALVAGEPRATHVYLAQGADPADAAARWRGVLGDHAVVLLREEVELAGLLGPVAEHVRAALGDLVVAMTGRATVVDSRTQTPASLGLVGVHGSLTSTEMTVPLLRWDA